MAVASQTTKGRSVQVRCDVPAASPVVGSPAPQLAIQREVVRCDDADAGLQQGRLAMRSV
jgi:hypothetical protein